MEYSDAVRHRLRRVEGQIRGVLAMLDTERDCSEIVGQLSAVRGAVDRAIAAIVTEHLECCLNEEGTGSDDASQAIRAAINLLARSR
jgi:DNA-binding FrmR family transcriptional regulator